MDLIKMFADAVQVDHLTEEQLTEIEAIFKEEGFDCEQTSKD